MKFSILAVFLSSLLFGLNLSSAAVEFSGNFTPDSVATEAPNTASYNSLFTTVLFASTSWVAEDGFLKIFTAPSRGIWFGAHPSIGSDPAGFAPSLSTVGNKLRVTSLLTSGSKSWDAYFYDSNGFGGAFNFEDTENGNNRPGVWGSFDGESVRLTDETFNLNVLHTYEIHIHNGIVAYSIDGSEVARGAAIASGPSGLVLIGDESGPTPTGSGSMWVDFMTFDNNAGELAPIPELSSSALIGGFIALSAVVVRRRYS